MAQFGKFTDVYKFDLEESIRMKKALESAGFSRKYVEKLREPEMLGHIRDVIDDYEEFETKKHVICCDEITKELQEEYTSGEAFRLHTVNLVGDWVWNENEIELYQPKILNDKQYNRSSKLNTTLSSRAELEIDTWHCKDKLLGYPVLQFLIEHPKLMPREWLRYGQIKIFFLATCRTFTNDENVEQEFYDVLNLYGYLSSRNEPVFNVLSGRGGFDKHSYFACMK